MPYFVVAEADGTIRQVSQVDETIWDMLQDMPEPFAGGTVVAIDEHPTDVAAYQAAHYVADGVVTERLAMTPDINTTTITANGTDIVSIINLPNPCTVAIGGPVPLDATVVEDGEVQFTADVLGDYTIRITARPAYLDYSVVIHAT